MRVLFLLDRFSVGGAERHTIDLAIGLRAHGIDPLLLTYFPGLSDNLPLSSISDAIFQLNASHIGSPRDWLRLSRKISDLNVDLVVAVNQKSLVLASATRPLWGRRRLPLWGILHTTVVTGFSSAARTILLRQAVRAADGMVFVSENQRQYWRNRGLMPRAQQTILNGINVEHYTPRSGIEQARAKSRLGIPDGCFVVGMCAQFRPEKNHGQLLRALGMLVAEGHKYHLVLIGDGPARSEVEHQAVSLGLSDHVTFTGEHLDVRPLVAAADVGVICSTSIETLSLAALEMMAMSIPMIMSDIGGASEMIIQGHNGYLFPPGDTDNLVTCLLRANLERTIVNFGDNARNTVLEKFSRDVMVQYYADLFRSLSAN